jgi:DNA helicase-2/ATP-dependent DNA helicase PcrA
MLHGQTHYGRVSSFMRELPEELLLWLSPRMVGRNAYAAPFVPHDTEPVFAASQPSGAVWRIGQRVFHQKFGEGTITGVEGGGTDGRVQVNFKHAGSKWLALEYAKLTAV